ncbi:MAG TPA: aspartyl-phosphate phosphatase Spo0E family protein [Clostridium sp.]
MSIQIELLRNKLEKLVAVTESLVDNDVVSLSQELDRLIFQYYLCKLE